MNSNLSRIDFKVNQNFAKKMSAETEACNVLIGEVDFLDIQFSVFVRLANPVVLGDFCEGMCLFLLFFQLFKKKP